MELASRLAGTHATIVDVTAIELRFRNAPVNELDIAELLESVRGLGHDPNPAATHEFAESATEVAIIALLVGERLADKALNALVEVSISWARRRWSNRRQPIVQVIYGPTGELLAEVEINLRTEHETAERRGLSPW